MIALIAEKPSVARISPASSGRPSVMTVIFPATGIYGDMGVRPLNSACHAGSLWRGELPQESLPILPPDFQLIPRQVKVEKGYKADPGVLKQLKVIKEVFDQCDRIIVATDAGREGELIFRYIFHYLNCRKPFVRLWISSLTDKAIREGLDNLQPGENVTITSTSLPSPAAKQTG